MVDKTCTKCGKEKPLTEFYPHKGHKDGLSSGCKTCGSESQRQKYQKRKEYYREKRNTPAGKKNKRNIHLKTRFGITLDDYDRMFKEQDGCCAICNGHWSKFKRRLNVHHDHKTGEVQGLLCTDCNTLLGRIEKAEETGIMDKIDIFRGRN